MANHKIEFLVIGYKWCTFRDYVEVKERKLDKKKIPKCAYAYRFNDENDNDTNTNTNPFTYFGIKYSIEEIMENFIFESQLISQMQRQNAKFAVRTKVGKWVILEPNEKVISL